MNARRFALYFVVSVFAGWVNRKQMSLIDYLLAENRVLREQLGSRRVRLNDDQRRPCPTGLRHRVGLLTELRS